MPPHCILSKKKWIPPLPSLISHAGVGTDQTSGIYERLWLLENISKRVISFWGLLSEHKIVVLILDYVMAHLHDKSNWTDQLTQRTITQKRGFWEHSKSMGYCSSASWSWNGERLGITRHNVDFWFKDTAQERCWSTQLKSFNPEGSCHKIVKGCTKVWLTHVPQITHSQKEVSVLKKDKFCVNCFTWYGLKAVHRCFSRYVPLPPNVVHLYWEQNF